MFIFICAGVVFVPIGARPGLGSAPGYLVAGAINARLDLLGVDVEARRRHYAVLVGLASRLDMLRRLRSKHDPYKLHI